MLCSRGMAGALTAAVLDAKLDENGTSFAEAASAAGYGGNHHKVCCVQMRFSMILGS